MTTTENQTITVEATVSSPLELVWKLWNDPLHVTQWNAASPEWHCPSADSDLREDGRFSARMAARDGSFGFDFGGTYTTVKPNEQVSYVMDDGRKTDVYFSAEGDKTHIKETFDAETTNPVDMQRGGWQAILDNFKLYAEYAAVNPPHHFTTLIDAPRERVWEKITGRESYMEWAGAAWPGSGLIGEWTQGSTIDFVDVQHSGTRARISELRKDEFIKADHIAMLMEGKEDTQSEMAKNWIGAREVYFLNDDRQGKTRMDVLMYIYPEWAEIANDWPKALNKLKEISENQ
ncbi:MAG: SRPBCC family protein [Mucilaginibacter polytrichastri]|nr:SRPBCC family protein [Mucilaginibacter polytrichastri]